jgi:hypothetical protein
MCTDTISEPGSIRQNEWAAVNKEIEWLLKKAFVALFEAFLWHVLGITEENKGNV